MITTAILGALVTLFEALVGLLPDFSVPSFMSGLPGLAATAGEQASLFGHWLPIGLLADLASACGTLWLALLGVRVGRRVISLFTGGGGG